jgi:protein-disulfide isomerase
MPIFGLGFFAAAVALTLVQGRPRWARVAGWLRWQALVGGLVAAALLALQGLVIGAWCKLCVVTDTSALALAVLVWTIGPRRWPTLGSAGLMTGGGLGLAAVAVPVLLAVAFPPPGMALAPLLALQPPPQVLREERPGVVTIVDFVDFECPFCRRMHPRLMGAIKAVGAPVRIVRKMVPIEQHPHAVPAAIAWCCADEQGQGDAMAEALFAATPDSLTPLGCEAIAAKLGLDLAAYRACATSMKTRQRIVGDLQEARSIGLTSLPTIYVGRKVFMGAAASQSDIESALRVALASVRG